MMLFESVPAKLVVRLSSLTPLLMDPPRGANWRLFFARVSPEFCLNIALDFLKSYIDNRPSQCGALHHVKAAPGLGVLLRFALAKLCYEKRAKNGLWSAHIRAIKQCGHYARAKNRTKLARCRPSISPRNLNKFILFNKIKGLACSLQFYLQL